MGRSPVQSGDGCSLSLKIQRVRVQPESLIAGDLLMITHIVSTNLIIGTLSVSMGYEGRPLVESPSKSIEYSTTADPAVMSMCLLTPLSEKDSVTS